jgi:hypothetical protein
MKPAYLFNHIKTNKIMKQTKEGKHLDRLVKALHPGMRKSESGLTYWENRINRSDRDRRKRI